MEDLSPEIRSQTTDMLREACDILREMSKTAYVRNTECPVVDISKLKRMLCDENIGKPSDFRR